MTKKDLVKVVHEIHGGISYKEAEVIVEGIFEKIIKALVRGEKVLLTGFGVFNVQDRKKRRVRNPRTGELIEIAPCKRLSFKPSKQLELNDHDQRTEETIL